MDREHRGGIYPLVRAFNTVIMRDLNIDTLVGDMFGGVPAVYATIVAYDEVAHHSGVESADALDILHKLDKQIPRLETAAREAPRPYHLVILSDHGQTGGATFKQRYGLSLEELVQDLATEKYVVQGDVDVHEDWNQVNALLTETVQYGQQAVSKPLGAALKSRTEDGQVTMGPKAAGAGATQSGEPQASRAMFPPTTSLVRTSSCWPRATWAWCTAPGSTSGRRWSRWRTFSGHAGGTGPARGRWFLLVRSEAEGPVVIGAEGEICGMAGWRADPLATRSNAALHLRRDDGLPYAPDIYVRASTTPRRRRGGLSGADRVSRRHGRVSDPPFCYFRPSCQS